MIVRKNIQALLFLLKEGEEENVTGKIKKKSSIIESIVPKNEIISVPTFEESTDFDVPQNNENMVIEDSSTQEGVKSILSAICYG